jgi:hypothetical protein
VLEVFSQSSLVPVPNNGLRRLSQGASCVNHGVLPALEEPGVMLEPEQRTLLFIRGDWRIAAALSQLK